MKPSLADIKKKIKEQEEKKATTGKSKTFGDMYPFWDIEEEQKAVVRVLPYKGMEDDALSPFIDKLEHVLSINGEDRKIPCIKMYGEVCPICALSAKFYKADGKGSEKGKYYWRDKKSLGSVYVVKDPLPANEETNENDQGKMKIVQFGNQLSAKYDKRFKAMLADDEIDDLPWSLTNGLDFQIIKEMNGEYAKYDTSSDFVRKATSLPADFLETFEPVDLSKYIPPNPGLDKVQRMLDAHLTGGDYKDEDGDSKSNVTKPKPTVKETVKEEVKTETKRTVEPVAEAVEAESSDSSDDDDDFLEKLKRRSKK